MAEALIALAAGGTGGHLFPADAVAQVLLERGHRPVLLTDERSARFRDALSSVASGQVEMQIFEAGRIHGSIIDKAKGVISMGRGMIQCARWVQQFRPNAVVGFGGYPSFAPVQMASWQHIPTMVHEQNAVIGRANKMLAGSVDRIALSVKLTMGLSSSAQARAVVTGNPVRRMFLQLREQPYPAIEEGGPIRLLVLGGSLGASIFAEVVPQAIQQLPEQLRSRLVITQQCRSGEEEALNQAYQAMGLPVEIAPFFNDAPERIAGAHLVIARAGASTVTELMVAGRPAILVPYPHATDNHQAMNAKVMQDSGGAIAVLQEDFSPDYLRSQLELLITDARQLAAAAQDAKAAAQWQAADALADEIEQLIAAKAAGQSGATSGRPASSQNQQAA